MVERSRSGTFAARLRLVVDWCLVPELHAEGVELGDGVEVGRSCKALVVEQIEEESCVEVLQCMHRGEVGVCSLE
jgi:hypothetical protein